MTQATVEVKSSLYYGREVSGNFPFYGVQQGDRWCSREVYLRIERDGKQINVHANRSDFVVTGQNGVVANVDESGAVEEILSEEELEKIIQARFDVMSNMTSSIITGDIRSLIISGAPGVGKTFELEGRLKKAEAEKVVNKVTHLKGKISPLGLYITLYHHRNRGDVILFDDIDSVFGEETTLNLLKAALDSSVQRTLSWKSTTKILSDEDIPTDFDFCGTCVFITNTDFDRVIERGLSDAEHFKALVSRSNYLDLCVHTNREVMVRVKQIVKTSDILKDNDLTEDDGKEIISWIEENYEEMREISARTIIKIGSYINANRSTWKDTASVMLKRRK